MRDSLSLSPHPEEPAKQAPRRARPGSRAGLHGSRRAQGRAPHHEGKALGLNVHRSRAIDIHPPFTCIRMISVDLASRFSPGFFVTLTVAWRRLMFALVLLASPPAGASVAFGFDAIELAQAQPEAQ